MQVLRFPIPKSEARKIVRSRRDETTSFDLKEKSKNILERLIQLDDFVYAKKIFAYISADEKDFHTKTLVDYSIGEGKSIYLPKHYGATKTLRRSPFLSYEELILNESDGYWEPKVGIDEDMSDIDLVFVPCIAVSMLGQRVGAGAGYYDKLLRNTYAPKYVLAFEYQLFNAIESQSHDIRVDVIITERRVLRTKSI